MYASSVPSKGARAERFLKLVDGIGDRIQGVGSLPLDLVGVWLVERVELLDRPAERVELVSYAGVDDVEKELLGVVGEREGAQFGAPLPLATGDGGDLDLEILVLEELGELGEAALALTTDLDAQVPADLRWANDPTRLEVGRDASTARRRDHRGHRPRTNGSPPDSAPD